MTYAQAALIIAKIGRLASKATADLAEGMWNPDFCAADAQPYAISLHDDFVCLLDQLSPRKE